MAGEEKHNSASSGRENIEKTRQKEIRVEIIKDGKREIRAMTGPQFLDFVSTTLLASRDRRITAGEITRNLIDADLNSLEMRTPKGQDALRLLLDCMSEDSDRSDVDDTYQKIRLNEARSAAENTPESLAREKEVQEKYEAQVKSRRADFEMNFPEMSKAIQKSLEKEGFRVSRVYYRIGGNHGEEFSIYADVSSDVKNPQSSFAYAKAGDPGAMEARRTITVERWNLQRNCRLPHLDSGAVEPDIFGDLLIDLATAGATAGVRLLARTMLSAGEKMAVSRAVRAAASDAAGLEARAEGRLAARIGSDEERVVVRNLERGSQERVSARAPTERVDPARAPTERVDPERAVAEFTRGKSLVEPKGPTLSMPRAMPSGGSAELGPELAKRCDDLGISREVVKDIQSYGYSQRDIERFLDSCVKARVQPGDIRQKLLVERELMKHYREMHRRVLPGDLHSQRNDAIIGGIKGHDGNVRDAIGTRKFVESVRDWNLRHPKATEPGKKLMHKFARDAEKYAKSVEKGIVQKVRDSGFRVSPRDLPPVRDIEAPVPSSERLDNKVLKDR